MSGLAVSRATVDAWNGFAAAPTAWYSVLNGGHGDSAENKVLEVDLDADAPRWVVVHPGSAKPGAPDALYYPDGLPASRHTYYSAQFIAARNRVMTFGAAAVWGSGNAGGPVVDGFDVSTRTWDRQGTWNPAPFNWIAQSVARDPATDDVYVAGHGVFAKWTQRTAAWSTFSLVGAAQFSWEFGPTLVDVKRNRLVHVSSADSAQTVDLATYAARIEKMTGDLKSVSNHMQIVHDLDRDRYLLVHETAVYAIDPGTWATMRVATAPVPVNGAHNRFAYFERLGGVAYLPEFGSDVLFLPTR